MTKTQNKVFQEILKEFQEFGMELKAQEINLRYFNNVGWFVSLVNDTNRMEMFLGDSADNIIPDNLELVRYYYKNNNVISKS